MALRDRAAALFIVWKSLTQEYLDVTSIGSAVGASEIHRADRLHDGSQQNIVSFDCLGIKFDKSFTTYSTFSTPTFTTYSSLVSPTKTDNSDLTIGLGIPLGISVIGWLALVSFFCFKK